MSRSGLPGSARAPHVTVLNSGIRAVLSLSAARAPRNAQGRGPFNSDATNVATHKYVIVEEPRRLAAAAAQVGRVAQAPSARQMAREASLCGPALDKHWSRFQRSIT